MIILYTGNGKGKTSACVGQAMRALGQGLPVAFAQFFKREGVAGEQSILARLLGDKFRVGGMGFFRDEADRIRHRQSSEELLKWASKQTVSLLVLDEAIYALDSGLLDQEGLAPLLSRSSADFHIVLSGRNAPHWLIEAADLVTDMQEVKHPYRLGIPAARGIEF